MAQHIKLLGSGIKTTDALGKVQYAEEYYVEIDAVDDDPTLLVPKVPPAGLGVQYDRADLVEHMTPLRKRVRVNYSTNGSGRLPPNVDDDDPQFSDVSMSVRDEVFEIPIFRKRYQSRVDTSGGIETVSTWEPDVIRVEVPVTDLQVVVNVQSITLLELQSVIQFRVGQLHDLPVTYLFKGPIGIQRLDRAVWQIRYRWTTHAVIQPPQVTTDQGEARTDIIVPTTALTVGSSYIRIPGDEPDEGPPSPPRIETTMTAVDDQRMGYVGLPGNPIS